METLTWHAPTVSLRTSMGEEVEPKKADGLTATLMNAEAAIAPYWQQQHSTCLLVVSELIVWSSISKDWLWKIEYSSTLKRIVYPKTKSEDKVQSKQSAEQNPGGKERIPHVIFQRHPFHPFLWSAHCSKAMSEERHPFACSGLIVLASCGRKYAHRINTSVLGGLGQSELYMFLYKATQEPDVRCLVS